MSKRNRLITMLVTAVVFAVLVAMLAPAAFGQVIPTKTVSAGDTWVVSDTTRLNVLTIEAGAKVTAPAGYALTLTVNGVETGQALVTTAGWTPPSAGHLHGKPGTHRGGRATSCPTRPPGPPGPPLMFPFRQALYVGAGGIDREKSVPAAVHGRPGHYTFARNLAAITSTGEDFTASTWPVERTAHEADRSVSSGNGRSDFIGLGAGIVGTGGSTSWWSTAPTS